MHPQLCLPMHLHSSGTERSLVASEAPGSIEFTEDNYFRQYVCHANHLVGSFQGFQEFDTVLIQCQTQAQNLNICTWLGAKSLLVVSGPELHHVAPVGDWLCKRRPLQPGAMKDDRSGARNPELSLPCHQQTIPTSIAHDAWSQLCLRPMKPTLGSLTIMLHCK